MEGRNALRGGDRGEQSEAGQETETEKGGRVGGWGGGWEQEQERNA